MADRVEFISAQLRLVGMKLYPFSLNDLAHAEEMNVYLEKYATYPGFNEQLTFFRRCFHQNIADLKIAKANKLYFEAIMELEHAKMLPFMRAGETTKISLLYFLRTWN